MEFRNSRWGLLLAFAMAALGLPSAAAAQNQQLIQMRDGVDEAHKRVYDRYGGPEERVTNYGGSKTYRTYKMVRWNTDRALCRTPQGKIGVLLLGAIRTQKLVETFSNGRSWPRPGDGDYTYTTRFDIVVPLRVTLTGGGFVFAYDLSAMRTRWSGDEHSWTISQYDDNFRRMLRNQPDQTYRNGLPSELQISAQTLESNISQQLDTCQQVRRSA
ncbi:hypothetical protein INR77_11325 [Erythrobacter sp. SCSIO 43205]|uniref:hypothetical protein n=1 Tax=Erythrobacter sp. SCSIO 43205 TaxID=2779361 RepID=UPI001CA9653C|nr:hypothetical protein [Erythrobacter sp. SCSIO 43205]UAB77393.1 hypothetical protein INR77_11325 [Erythrobacter sp. SCSIO 43205]